MNSAMKLAIGSGGAFVFMSLFGFVLFPALIKSEVKKMVNLKPGTDLRDMFVKFPFPFNFNVYLFNTTNPLDVQNGSKPILEEAGPYCFEQWKEKTNVRDNEADDTMSYNMLQTFFPRSAPGCTSLEEEITIPHPVIMGILNQVMRTKPGAMNIAMKAINSIFKNPSTVFLTTKVKDLLFGGIKFECSGKDFASKAICPQLAHSLKTVSEGVLAFSLLDSKNGTESPTYKVKRGKKDYHLVGSLLEYAGEPKLNTWSTDLCNKVYGTDGTVFPSFLKKEEGILIFSPDLCRTLRAFYVRNTKFDGYPVRYYTVSLGDMSTNPDEKCYCSAPDQCLKKGVMDLFYCSNLSVIASFPHFYDADESYLDKVEGLHPNEIDHSIRVFFESMSGTPISSRTRLQINFPMEPNPKVPLLNNVPELIYPIFWIEEALEIPKDVLKPLKMLFLLMLIVKIVTYLVMISSLAGTGAAGYLFHKQGGMSTDTKGKVQKVKTFGTTTKDEENKKGVKENANNVLKNEADKESRRY